MCPEARPNKSEARSLDLLIAVARSPVLSPRFSADSRVIAETLKEPEVRAETAPNELGQRGYQLPCGVSFLAGDCSAYAGDSRAAH